MIVLGIDPGLANTGWGIVDYEYNKFNCISYGVIETEKDLDCHDRVSFIADKIKHLTDKFTISDFSIEDIFFAKNEISAMNVAKVIGSIFYVAYLTDIRVFTYTPLQIKMSITGTGRADKHQVQEMTRILLKLDKIPKPDHCADALAAAVSHVNINSTLKKFNIFERRINA